QRAARRRIDHGPRYRPATTIRPPSRLTVRVVQPTVGGIPASARARTQSKQQLARTGEHPTPSAMSFAAGKFQPQADPLRSCRTSRTGRLLLGDSASQQPPDGVKNRTSAFPESTRPRRHAVAVGAGAGCGHPLSDVGVAQTWGLSGLVNSALLVLL